MKTTKLLSLLSNIAVLLNVIAGGLALYWFVLIPVFALIHIGLRLSYLSFEQKQNANTTQTQTMIAPPQVRKFASILTGIIMAVLLYGIGYGVHLLLEKVA